MQTHKSEFSGGSWIVEQLTLDLPDVERSVGRRAWRESQAAWEGDEPQFWWHWLSAAIKSIGLATRTIDCSVSEAMDLVEGGAELITWAPQPETDGCWIRIRRKSGNLYDIDQARDDGVSSTGSRRRVNRLLRGISANNILRCVVVRDDVRFGKHETKGMRPLNRLVELLKPEWSDIWIVLVFAFVVGVLMLATPIAVEALVNTVAFGRFLQPVLVLALILLTFLTFSAALRALQTWVVELIQRRLFARVAGDLAYRLPRVNLESTDGLHVPELANRFFDIVTVQKVAAQLLLDGVGLILTATIGMAVLAFYHPWLLGFDVVMMASIAFIIVVLGRGAVGSAVKESKNKYEMASWLEDIGRCPTAFRTLGGADLALERTDRLVHQYLEARQKHFRILMRQILFALGLQAVASTVLLGLGGWLVISGQLTLGQLVAAELIVTVIVGAFAKLGKHMESFYDLLAAVDKLGVLFDLPTEPDDGVLQLESDQAALVCLQSIQYRFAQHPVFTEPVSARFSAGSVSAVVGSAGTGKSLLVDLIAGLRTPAAGHITIDGVDPLDVRPDVLRSHVAVARPGEIFNGTFSENVHLHRETVTSSDVRDALESVGLYAKVLALPEGLETELNGSGHPLSQTEQDLLCLARSVAGRPRLLLIDGLLDSLSDDAVLPILTALQEGSHALTVVIATGRQFVAENCDQQTRLESSVLMSGSSEELVA